MADSIQFRRGLRSAVKPLPVGMPGFVEDEDRLLIGKGDGTNAELPNRVDIDNINSQMAENTKKISYKEKQTELLSLYYRKLTTGIPVTNVHQGDSLTYGVDRYSTDKRNAKSDPTLDVNIGSTGEMQAGKTYPEFMQERLNEIYGSGKVTVINRGFSGDWVENSLNRWTTNPNANLAFIMLGTNDSDLSASWVPSDVKGNIQKYITDMRTLIERYLDWGTAVILLTPPRLKAQESYTSGNTTATYRNALKQLGKEYNIPVFDVERFLDGCDETYYSDGIHLNTKGYSLIGARLTTTLIGVLHSIPKIKSGDNISVRVTRDNFVKSSGVTLLNTSISDQAEEYTDGTGVMSNLIQNSSMYFPIYTEEDNLVLIPIFYSGNGVLQVDLDFGIEQGSFVNLASIELNASGRFKPASSMTNSASTNSGSIFNGTITTATNTKYLIIANKGYHNLKVSNVTATTDGYIRFGGFVVLSYKEFSNMTKIANILNGGTSVINPLYTFETHATLEDTTVVSTQSISFDSVKTALGITSSADYWKNRPLKVSVYNYDQQILEYVIQVGQNGTGSSTWKFGLLGQVNLIATPDNSKIRTITAISYDATSKTIILTYGGALTRATQISITTL